MARFSICRCPECATLDQLYPGEGHQLALEPLLTRRPARQAQAERRSLLARAVKELAP